jgi:hypothetical protein
MIKTLVGAAASLALVAGTAPAEAAHNHYGKSARHVAREIHCKRFDRNGGGELNLDSGVCHVRGRRVNVITFRGRTQQTEWNGAAKLAFGPRFFWAKGTGAVVVARNGNKTAAKIGARRLPGRVVHG